ncbi:MAG TPA: acyltransferase domain-containing protein, partial [Albitalea sp.]|nr:acyltransferase domain-containing protein [Albitalea sp.]
RAFRRHTEDKGFCRIGSVKSNVGHMVIAAGAGALIKTALSLSTEQIPPNVHYDSPNPKIDFDNSPFIVNDTLTPWPRAQQPRRAGVNASGVGGTNAHVVLEEAPLAEPSSPAVGPQLLQLSAKTRSALDAMASQLADHLAAHPQINLADVAHTLQVGRSRFAHRLCVVGQSVEQAAAALRSADDPLRAARALGASVPSLVWLFPGQGSQYAGMGRGLYEHDPAFRAAFDECIDALKPVLAFDLKARMFDGAADALVATGTTQPATFCLEYALAQSWLARGARPVALIGHSVGEFVAAVLAGVMTLADAARLVAQRGAMMQALPAGSMLSVRLSADKLLPLLPSELSLAAENGPTACVVAGPTPAVEAWRAKLEGDGIVARMLQTSHAFHSSMMDPAVAPFEAEVRQIALSAPRIPIVSTLTGNWLADAEATDPHYWARHLREAVRFSPALRTALAQHDAAFLEMGPRGTLSTLARQHTAAAKVAPIAIASLGDTAESEATQLTLAHGQLWTLGIELPVSAASPSADRRRVRLPSYPFERKRYWIEAGRGPLVAAATSSSNVPAESSSPTPPMSTQPTPASRRPQLVSRLRALFEDVAGTDINPADSAVSFVELGLDSLTLTQAALQVKKQFSVNLTFRQLMEKYRSFDTLAEFLDTTLPPEVIAAPPVAPLVEHHPHAPVHAPMPAQHVAIAPIAMPAVGGNAMQSLIAQQMQLMQQQLALLSGTAVALPVAMPVAAPAPVVAAAPVPTAVAAPAAATAAAPVTEEGGPVRYDVKKAFG